MKIKLLAISLLGLSVFDLQASDDMSNSWLSPVVNFVVKHPGACAASSYVLVSTLAQMWQNKKFSLLSGYGFTGAFQVYESFNDKPSVLKSLNVAGFKLQSEEYHYINNKEIDQDWSSKNNVLPGLKFRKGHDLTLNEKGEIADNIIYRTSLQSNITAIRAGTCAAGIMMYGLSKYAASQK